MSKPTKREKEALREVEDDSERYHSTFDSLLQYKLKQLDPEWMKAMKKIYDKSGRARWCA